MTEEETTMPRDRACTLSAIIARPPHSPDSTVPICTQHTQKERYAQDSLNGKGIDNQKAVNPQ
jgi:hypothetical protein